MEVILLERVDKLGNMGEVVSVKSGYGRNFLLPQGKALRSNKANLAKFEAQRAALEARNAELRDEAKAESNKLDGHKFVVTASRRVGKNAVGQPRGPNMWFAHSVFLAVQQPLPNG